MDTEWKKGIFIRNLVVTGWIFLVLSLCLFNLFQGQGVVLTVVSVILAAFGILIMLFLEGRYRKCMKDAGKRDELFGMFMNSVSDLICFWDEHGRLLYANPPYTNLVSKVFPALQDRETPDLFFPNTEDIWKDPPSDRTEKTVLLPDGTKKVFDVFISPVCNDNGRCVMIFAARDITDMKRDEAVVKENLEFYDMVIKVATDFINIPFKDMDKVINTSLNMIGKWLNVDRAYIFIYDFEKGTTSNTHEWCAKDVDPQIQNLQNLSLDIASAWVKDHKQGRLVHIPSVADLPADSSVKQLLEEQAIQSLIVLPMISNGQCLGFVGFDSVRTKKTWTENEIALLRILAEIYANAEYVRIAETERKRLENQLIQVSKLESVGKLAGGVAHDLNNMLVPILGYSDMLMNGVAMDDSCKSFVKQISEAGKRARDIVRQLLTFSCRQTVEMKPVNINRIIGEFEPLLRHVVREDIALKLVLGPSVPKIMGNRGQLEQVIMNLVINARDSISDTGTITIETSVVKDKNLCGKMLSADQDTAGITEGGHGCLASRSDNFVVLRISDTGCGMDHEIVNHIFEPFFTTKDTKGVGFGLATAYGIVKQHKGSINVDSEVGTGSTFTLYFPVIDMGVSLKDSSADKGPETLHGDATVLLVEDNQQVGDAISAILQTYGYNVIYAGSGRKAVELLEISSGDVDLVLTDMVMPGMNGYQLAEHVRRKFPCIRVICMSGYSRNIVDDVDMLQDGISFIQKPFTAEILAAKIREVIKAKK